MKKKGCVVLELKKDWQMIPRWFVIASNCTYYCVGEAIKFNVPDVLKYKIGTQYQMLFKIYNPKKVPNTGNIQIKVNGKNSDI